MPGAERENIRTIQTFGWKNWSTGSVKNIAAREAPRMNHEGGEAAKILAKALRHPVKGLRFRTGEKMRSARPVRVPRGQTHPQKYLPTASVRRIIPAIGSTNLSWKRRCVRKIRKSNLRKGFSAGWNGSSDLAKT